MNTYAVYFYPRGSLASNISSDTLFGAVCWGISILGLRDDLSAWLKGQQAAPLFAFSAPFPVIYEKGKPLLRAYPRPVNFDLSPNAFESLAQSYQKKQGGSLKDSKIKLSGIAKKMKGINHVSEGVLSEIAAGKMSPATLLLDMAGQQQTYFEIGDLLMTQVEKSRLEKSYFDLSSIKDNKPVAVQHNHIDRMGGSTAEGMLFYREETFFRKGCGLWALVRTDEQTMDRYIHPALRYLADTGLGADRAVGKGQFDIKVENAPALPENPQANAIMMLSRYLPTSNDLGNGGLVPLSYRLTTLRPKREQKFVQKVETTETPPIYKKSVRMFDPGSVFACTKRQDIYGQLAEVVPADFGGPVYQSGAAIPVFLYIKEG